MKRLLLLILVSIILISILIIRFQLWIYLMPESYQKIWSAVEEARENGWPEYEPRDSLTDIIDLKLDTLRAIGVNIPTSTTGRDLAIFHEDDLELSESYEALYYVLGYSKEYKDSVYFSNSTWTFDTECIAGNGSYVFILQQLNRISENQLQITDIKDTVDISNKYCSVSFNLSGKQYHFPLTYQDDWIDQTLLVNISNLVRAKGMGSNFTYFDTDGQEVTLGWATEAQFKELNKLADLRVERIH